MPPHIRPRKDRGDTLYIADGRKSKSLETKSQRVAKALLKKYENKKYTIEQTPTVGEYFEEWIDTKKEPMVRKSWLRDVNQHFKKYILPAHSHIQMSSVSVSTLASLQASLVASGLSIKSTRNVLDSSYRTMWKDAWRAEIVEHIPFERLAWPQIHRPPPDPFTPEERDQILAYVLEHHTFYYPFVYHQFHTGMRPSETVALRLADIDFTTGMCFITKSRHLDVENAPKTIYSRRKIILADEVIQLVKQIRLGDEGPNSYVYYNQVGKPINANDWAGKFWGHICSKVGVRHRKFYSTRHTFITEMVKAGHNLKAIADYCGTSIKMLEADYCARLDLRHATVLQPITFESSEVLESKGESVVVPTGIEPQCKTLGMFGNVLISKICKLREKGKLG